MFNLNLEEIFRKLEESGIDEKSLAIRNEMETEINEINNLDVADLSPSELSAKLSSSLGKMTGKLTEMLDEAKKLEPIMIDFQQEFLRSLNDPEGLGSIKKLMEDANINDFDADELVNDITSKMSTPKLSGLGGLSDSISKLNPFKVEGIGNIGTGVPGGLDFAKVIPKIKIKKEIEYDEDGEPIGEKLKSVKLSFPATAPVIDATEEPDAPVIDLKVPAEIKKNPILNLNSLRDTIGRTPINKFETAVTTSIQSDPSTGENIVFEAQRVLNEPPVFVPSGFASNEEFEAKYKQGREAASGKLQNIIGNMRENFSGLSKGFTDAAEVFSNVSKVQVPKIVEPKEIKGVRNTSKDSVLGISINLEEMRETEKELDRTLKPKLDALDTQIQQTLNPPLPPGAEIITDVENESND